MAKPLLWGDTTLDAKRIEEMRKVEAEWDRSYVPGYSEIRRANELAVRDGRKTKSIPRLQWVRVGHVDGKDVENKDMLEWAFLGYRFVEPKDLKEWGFEMPPTAHIDAGGKIRREDAALAYIDAEQHARNVARQDRINAEFHAQAEEPRRGERGAEIEVVESTTRRLADISDAVNYLND